MIEVDELQASSIRRAHGMIDPAFTGSPQFVHERLSERLGVTVIVKVETVNPIRSFKGRGTWVAVSALAEAERIGTDRPILCVSAGNFGQGVAYAARALDVPAIVFAGLRANSTKITRMRALGATVMQIGEAFDDARAASESYAIEHDVELLVDGQDPRIATGAATMALEVTDAVSAGSLPTPAIASVPVGNGALINGIGSWMRAEAPSCQVIGIQAEAAPAMVMSWRAERPINTESAATYADGIATRVAIPRAVELMAGRVDDMVLVSETALRAAQAELTKELGITVEGAAAASWAGLLAGPRPHGPALVIITGSNV